MSHQQLQEKQRSSVPKERLRKVRRFQPGDTVLVYDTQTKLNSKGIVKDCRSNNSYTVLTSDKQKHISGDYITLISKALDNNYVEESDMDSKVDSNCAINDSSSTLMDLNSDIMDNNSVTRDSNISDRISNSILDFALDSDNGEISKVKQYFFPDNESVCSDSSDEYLTSISKCLPKTYNNRETISNIVRNSVTKRKYKPKHLKLKDGLSTIFPESRTRSGRI